MVDLLPPTFDWQLALRHLAVMAIAYVLALPVAWDREVEERTAGLRTFPLVAVAACGYTLVGFDVLTSTGAEARVVQGIITGMGFVGGGAILKDHGSAVRGTATAAALWGTGAVGLAVALGRLEIAVIISLTTFLTLRLLTRVKRDLNGKREDEEAREGS